MSTLLIQSGTLDDIADAIRAKTGSAASMTPLQMPTQIASIPSGGGGNNEILDVYYDNESAYAPLTKNYICGISGTLHFLFFSRARGLNNTANGPFLKKNGTTETATFNVRQVNQVPQYGTFYWTTSVSENDELEFSILGTGTNGNHIDLIIALIEGAS